MMTEQKAKMATLKNAKSFINELKGILNDIEAKLNGNEEEEQLAAIINAISINECLTQYDTKAKEILNAIAEMENKNKLN